MVQYGNMDDRQTLGWLEGDPEITFNNTVNCNTCNFISDTFDTPSCLSCLHTFVRKQILL